MEYKLGDIVEYKGMKLRLEKPGKDCQRCALEFFL